jgi:hypothetical protein
MPEDVVGTISGQFNGPLVNGAQSHRQSDRWLVTWIYIAHQRTGVENFARISYARQACFQCVSLPLMLFEQPVTQLQFRPTRGLPQAGTADEFARVSLIDCPVAEAPKVPVAELKCHMPPRLFGILLSADIPGIVFIRIILREFFLVAFIPVAQFQPLGF